MRELRKMMLLESVLLLLPLLLCLHFRLAVSEIFFEERFEDGWKSRWVLSDWKRAEGKAGTFKYTAGKWSGDPDDKGTQNNIEEQKDEDLELPLFDLSTIETATNKFSINNKLGEGGFESVYEGTLLDGKEIAVKRLSRSSGQGMKEFKNEVILIAKLQHRNLVKLLHKFHLLLLS
ncbi:G-type lectin S-receptor-like serine/threonine-protein kinase RKS1 [Rosa rugosa]|uniref:G-type lectin S-receptor-like serine/threonine-protein kinase RKS1 n=1 Tax=Rosa rugosa TaxID=74645 RepID=UPI002B40649F|nr:G-type lectin S-receptor-like serine/threonine-protein kinase RKS1 [Rosa rugosa]XP_062006506.1 G-type lectin S-receptor-like serine/threonine-protein kinase RKS1 [Rosa rugosa]XP_062017542.1 G-type lectin S-receptor-like serine/threonine-protein kinase RKS1 [Rosa rugosa]XP_062027400.1 G-type lectin S-receptor-like serine/threonine-protein kinase RKS1 [Rosa rugosa]